MFQNASSSSQSSSTGNPNRQKFVEGTVSQLARVLYSLHREYGAQPSNAIFEAITTFGDDVERNTILQSARCSAEALARKQKALQSNAKFKSSMTVFEQAQQLNDNDSEDTIPLMKQIWLQLVKALLLQKNIKNTGNPPITFEMTPTAGSIERANCKFVTRGVC